MLGNSKGVSELIELFFVLHGEANFNDIQDSLVAWVWRMGHGIVTAEPTYFFVSGS